MMMDRRPARRIVARVRGPPGSAPAAVPLATLAGVLGIAGVVFHVLMLQGGLAALLAVLSGLMGTLAAWRMGIPAGQALIGGAFAAAVLEGQGPVFLGSMLLGILSVPRSGLWPLAWAPAALGLAAWPGPAAPYASGLAAALLVAAMPVQAPTDVPMQRRGLLETLPLAGRILLVVLVTAGAVAVLEVQGHQHLWPPALGALSGTVARLIGAHPANARSGILMAGTGTVMSLGLPLVLFGFAGLGRLPSVTDVLLLGAAWGVLALGAAFWFLGLGVESTFHIRPGIDRATVAIMVAVGFVAFVLAYQGALAGVLQVTMLGVAALAPVFALGVSRTIVAANRSSSAVLVPILFGIVVTMLWAAPGYRALL